VYVSVYDGSGADGCASNIVLYGYSPNRTSGDLDLFGRVLLVDDATNARSPVTYGQWTNAQPDLAAWSQYPATATVELDRNPLHWSDKWQSWITTGTNTTTLNIGPYGDTLLSLAANDVTDTNTSGALLILGLTQSGTNLLLQVSTTNVIAALVPQEASPTNGFPTNWTDMAGYTSTYPFATNGAYTITFGVPTAPPMLYRVRSASGSQTNYSTVREVRINGNVTITGTISGNGSSLTNLGTNSLSASALAYLGPQDLSGTNLVAQIGINPVANAKYMVDAFTGEGNVLYRLNGGWAGDVSGLWLAGLLEMPTNQTLNYKAAHMTNINRITLAGSGATIDGGGGTLQGVSSATITNLAVRSSGNIPVSVTGSTALSLAEYITGSLRRGYIGASGTTGPGVGLGFLDDDGVTWNWHVSSVNGDGKLRGSLDVQGFATVTNGVTTVNGGITNGGALAFTGAGQRYVGTNYFTGTNLQVFVNGQSFWIPLGQTNAP